MAEEWEMVVPSRAVSPAPVSLTGDEGSQQAAAIESHGPAAHEDGDLHVFAAPWESPVKVGSAAEDAGVSEASAGHEDGRLGGSAVFVSAPPASEGDGSPSVATPMQVAKPVRAESLLDADAEMVSSQVSHLHINPASVPAATVSCAVMQQ
jgi:hypothetical protein